MMTPPLAGLHGFIKRAGHVDVAKHLEVPGLTPARVADFGQASARDGAGVVHQNVDVRMRRREIIDRRAHRKIERVRHDSNIVARCDLLTRCLQVGRRA